MQFEVIGETTNLIIGQVISDEELVKDHPALGDVERLLEIGAILPLDEDGAKIFPAPEPALAATATARAESLKEYAAQIALRVAGQRHDAATLASSAAALGRTDGQILSDIAAAKVVRDSQASADSCRQQLQAPEYQGAAIEQRIKRLEAARLEFQRLQDEANHFQSQRSRLETLLRSEIENISQAKLRSPLAFGNDAGWVDPHKFNPQIRGEQPVQTVRELNRLEPDMQRLTESYTKMKTDDLLRVSASTNFTRRAIECANQILRDRAAAERKNNPNASPQLAGASA